MILKPSNFFSSFEFKLLGDIITEELGGTSIDKQLFSHLDADKTMIEGDMKPDPVVSDRQRRAVSSLARHKWPSNSIPYVFDETPGQSISKSSIIT